MKISDTGNSLHELVTKYKVNEDKVNTGQEKQIGNGAVVEEKVTLSPAAQEIQRAEKAVRALPDVREEKVQEVKRQIEAGEYEVKGDAIAEKMLTETLIDVMV